MILLEKHVHKDISLHKEKIKQIDNDLITLDINTKTGVFVFVRLVTKRKKIIQDLKMTKKRYKYLKNGCGIQEALI